MGLLTGRAKQSAADAFPVDSQIANGRNPVEGIRKNENEVFGPEDGVGQKARGTEKTQPPECQWNNDLFAFLSGMPLDQDSRKEEAVAHETNQFPNSQRAREQLVPMRCQMPQPFHGMKLKASSPTKQACVIADDLGICPN
jgi:hypothetical protein